MSEKPATISGVARLVAELAHPFDVFPVEAVDDLCPKTLLLIGFRTMLRDELRARGIAIRIMVDPSCYDALTDQGKARPRAEIMEEIGCRFATSVAAPAPESARVFASILPRREIYLNADERAICRQLLVPDWPCGQTMPMLHAVERVSNGVGREEARLLAYQSISAFCRTTGLLEYRRDVELLVRTEVPMPHSIPDPPKDPEKPAEAEELKPVSRGAVEKCALEALGLSRIEANVLIYAVDHASEQNGRRIVPNAGWVFLQMYREQIDGRARSIAAMFSVYQHLRDIGLLIRLDPKKSKGPNALTEQSVVIAQRVREILGLEIVPMA